MNNTTSMGLPPALASILSAGTQPAPQPMQPNPAAGLSGAMTSMQTFAPSYQEGGMIGPGGMPAPTSVGLAQQGQMPQGGMGGQNLEMQVSRIASQNPQGIAQLRAAVQEAMASGELTPQELNTLLQLIKVAAQNPEMYPYMRNFAIQQGLADEEDLPRQYDQGLVLTMLLVARAVEADLGGQSMMQDQPSVSTPQVASGPMPSMAKGGTVPDSRKSDGSVLINAHEGEYVIPAHIVKAKGTEFFDKLIGKGAQE